MCMSVCCGVSDVCVWGGVCVYVCVLRSEVCGGWVSVCMSVC